MEFTGIAVFCSELNRAERSEELGASYVSSDALIHRTKTLIAVTQDVSCLCQLALPVEERYGFIFIINRRRYIEKPNSSFHRRRHVSLLSPFFLRFLC